MKNRKLGIIGGSGLYKMEGFEKTKWKKIITPWGKPSDEILIAKLDKEEICFIPRHSRGHKINPTNINFRANIDAMKQLGVTDIISVSAVGSLKEDLEPGKFVIVDQFIDRTFSRAKTFFDEEIVAHVSMAKPTSPGLSNCCEAALKKLNIKPRAKIVSLALAGDDPVIMLTGPIPASKTVLTKANLSINDIDIYEVNEAFAPVPLAWAHELKADKEKLNVNGGAMALGHPLGGTGAKLMTTLLHELERREGKYALQAICEGGGTANATIIKRIA